MPNTIVLKGDLGKRFEEGRAAGAIKPGHQIAQDTSGTFVVHGSAGGTFPEGLVAIEDAKIGGTIDTAYASGDLVPYFIAQPGDVLYLFLAAGENAAINSALSSNGDGTMQVAAGTEGVLWRAQEAVDNSAGGAAVRIKARRV